ncbi:TetR/AcrR family transcriptional regulator [Nocardia seriolae]|uniref:TetR/AcrR family transcriptional regulator n=1 Tax=Nocardia seriolae TaxID=37332 RepID=UPI0004B27BD5|nr:TetR/AcrR family transcriptional regulator [Nocardia seriolae]GEM28323.1 TetR family transcriptional regulator [Nocardia seriolae NBRC 15557]WKY49332.1 TetR/AcrR family transcriptional regulator [Nocardia seriolae]BAW06939.1 TetR family transcriptional regulator [Nocardia seriolae]BEK88475.1 TetR/AcrR family transcriptional regulator [Nocardia seriolae]BEK96229.1 TetR/AcrR family transcriptional regulator [Nocardia seriolae]
MSRVTGTRRRPAQPSPRDREPAADGRSTRWDGHKARRRTEMLDAALSVIEENGTEISVQQIADRLRVPRPVVYRHFDGRADLDDAIRRHIVESLMAELLPRLQPEGTVRELVRGAVGTYVGWVERHPNLHRFLAAADPHGESATVLAGARDRIGGRLADLFADTLQRFGIDRNRARPMAFGTVGFVDGVVNSWRAAPTLSSEQVEGILTESVLSLLEGNARSLDVPLTRDTVVADLYSRTEAARV